jgi:hypothetical protein
MSDKLSRRAVLLRGLQIPVGGAVLFGLGACGGNAGGQGKAAASACVDPHSLTDAEQSTRNSLGYVEAASNPQQVCGGCAFFHVDAQGTCGKCDMLSGGIVNSQGHCNSWSAKA